MIDTVRGLFGHEDPDAARGEVLTELPRGILPAVVEGVVERVLRRQPDDGRHGLAAMVVGAIQEHYDPGRPGPRDESLRRAERETLMAVRADIDERLDDLDAEREAAERRDGWAWEVGAPLTDHPDEDGLRDALDAVYGRLKAADDGLTDEELAAAFQDAYRGPLKYRTPRKVWQRWLPILADAPGVVLVDAGVWSLDGDPLDDDDLAAAIDDAVPSGVADRLPLATIYDRITDEGPPTPTAYLVTALRSFTDGEREVWDTESVAAGMTIPEAIAALPGVEPPEADAPMYRHTDDAEGADE